MKKDLFKFSKYLNLNFDGPQQIAIICSRDGLMQYETPPWPSNRYTYVKNQVIELIKELTYVKALKHVKMDLAIFAEGEHVAVPGYADTIVVNDYEVDDLDSVLASLDTMYTFSRYNNFDGWYAARTHFLGSIHTDPTYQRSIIVITDGEYITAEATAAISALSDIINSTGTFATYPVEIHAAIVPYYIAYPDWWLHTYIDQLVNVLPVVELDYTVQNDFVNFAMERLRGIIDYFFFTSANTDETYDGDDYLSTTIARDSIDYKSDLEKNNVRISFPLANNFARGWIDEQYEYFLELKIIELRDGSPSILWQGRLTLVSASDKEVFLTFDSALTSMARNGLSRMYQRTCPYKLYGRGCNLYKSDFSTSGTISAISGKVVTVSAASGEDDGYFTHGLIEDKNGNRRFIVSHSGTQLTLAKWSRGFQEDFDENGFVDVFIYPGCNKSIEQCAVKFMNSINFGGCPHLQIKNIFSGVAFS